MSPIPLSFSGFLDNQSPPMFSSKSLQDSFHTPSNNYLGPYQVQAMNSSVFSQGIPEIPHVRRLRSLQDTITKLQLENSSLKAECDAVQGAYNMLISQLTIMRSDSMTPADGPINVMLCMTPEGKRANPYTSYLEDNKGEPLNAEKIGNIVQMAREIWHEFRTCDIIKTNTTWSSMPLMVKKAFRSEISSDDSSKRKERKESTDDTTLSPKPKQTKLTLSPSPEDSGHSTGDSTSNRSAPNTGDSNTTSSSSVPGPCTPSSPSSPLYTFPDADDVSQFDNNYTRTHAPDAPPSNIIKGVDTGASVSLPLVKNPLLSMCPGSRSTPMCHQQKPAEALPQVTQLLEPTVARLVPIALEWKRQAEEVTEVTKTAPGEGPQRSEDSVNITQTALGETLPSSTCITPGDTMQPSTHGQEARPIVADRKKSSWRPPSNKSGRKIGGSLEEFNSYFEALSAEAKAKYTDESKKLVSDGIGEWWASGGGGVWAGGQATTIIVYASFRARGEDGEHM
ncbi:hypothetical protein EDD15DRAFT_2200788 [Pisolithus albus]|nr:hypothetical protein EDD15DRAFT_2200788 [Pisolithus albus]